MPIRLDHLQCSIEDIAPIVLMPSNPAKADWIASKLENARRVSQYREFTTWKGTYKAVPVSVVSTGIGCPSTAIAVEEAIAGNAKILLRIGTCGGAWRSDVPCGSVIIPFACVREEGTTREYVPLSFPAVADFAVTQCLEKTANNRGMSVYMGINRTHDAYYGSALQRQRWAKTFTSVRTPLVQQPILSSEMECAALFTIASLRDVRAGAILAVNADPEPLMLEGQESYLPVMRSGIPDAASCEQSSVLLALEAIPGLQKLLL